MERNDVVCDCFAVTMGEIEDAIRTKNLKTVEQVGEFTNAGTGCRAVLFSAMGHPFQQFAEMMSSSSVTSGSSRVCRSTDLCLPSYGLT